MAEVREALDGCELVLLIVDVTRKFAHADQSVLEMAKKSGTPVFLLLNKIDLLRDQKDKLLPIIDDYRKLHAFKEIIPLSARKSEGLDVLLEKVIRCLAGRSALLSRRPDHRSADALHGGRDHS